VFLGRKEFQKQFLINDDLRKYHYVLINAENYVNIISEINDSLMTKRIIEKNIEKTVEKNNIVDEE
jgi:hypothetical protein